MKTTTPYLRLSLPILCGALFTGCLTMPEENRDEATARLAVEIIPAPAVPAAQGGSLRLKEMTVTIVSDAGDTLRDTVTDAGSLLSKFPVRLNAPDGFHIIHPIYNLDPAKSWSVSVKTLDARDSVVHEGTVNAGALTAGTLRNVRMPLAARYADYEAVFALPADAVRRGGKIDRVEMAVDGAATCVTASLGDDSAKLTCENLPVGNRQVTLSVYGKVAGSAASSLLYKGSADVNITAGDAPTESVDLGSTDVSLGNVGMNVRLGGVGSVVMNVVMSGALNL
jgi:hypothetical protein